MNAKDAVEIYKKSAEQMAGKLFKQCLDTIYVKIRTAAETTESKKGSRDVAINISTFSASGETLNILTNNIINHLKNVDEYDVSLIEDDDAFGHTYLMIKW